jgi:hypothetical protein
VAAPLTGVILKGDGGGLNQDGIGSAITSNGNAGDTVAGGGTQSRGGFTNNRSVGYTGGNGAQGSQFAGGRGEDSLGYDSSGGGGAGWYGGGGGNGGGGVDGGAGGGGSGRAHPTHTTSLANITGDSWNRSTIASSETTQFGAAWSGWASNKYGLGGGGTGDANTNTGYDGMVMVWDYD